MLFWQNEVGLVLAFLLLAHCLVKGPRREAWFILTMACFYVVAEWANIMAWGKEAGYLNELPVILAVKGTFLVHFTGLMFAIMLSVSSLHIADNSKFSSWVRWGYIMATGLKSSLGTTYAAILLDVDTNDLALVSEVIEYFWIIPDVIVLVLGTTNPISRRWLKAS